MSTPDEGHNNIHALAAEEQRLAVTEDVLSDLYIAALEVLVRGDRPSQAGARRKLDHWDSVHKSVRIEHDNASDAHNEAQFGRDTMERFRAIRKGTAEVRPGIERSR